MTLQRQRNSSHRIVAVNRFYWPDGSATSQHLTDLAEYLAEQGLQVTVVTSRLSYEKKDRRLQKLERKSGVTILRVWTSRMGRSWLPGRALDYLTFYLSSFFTLLFLVRRDDILIAKTDPPMISVIAAIVARCKRAVLVNWCQDLFPEIASALGLSWAGGPLGGVMRMLRNTSLKSAQLNVVLNEKMRDVAVSQGVPISQIKVLDNWADPGIRPISASQNPLRHEWGVDGRMVIGYSGNLGRAHCSEAVATLVRDTADVPDLSWLFIGGGAGLDTLKTDPAISGEGNVIFKPYQDRTKLPLSLSVPDLHLITLDPTCEGLIMPSKLYGVLAAGRGIVFLGDQNGAVAHIVREHNLGITLDYSKPETWCRKVDQLSADRDEIIAMGRRARETYNAHYSTDRALSAWLSALLSVMPSAHHQAADLSDIPSASLRGRK